MIPSRDSSGYAIGKFLGRLMFIVAGYLLGKKYIQKKIEKSFPDKQNFPENNK